MVSDNVRRVRVEWKQKEQRAEVRRRVNVFLGLVVLAAGLFSVGPYQMTGQNGGKRPVDLKSDRIFPVPVGDSTGYALTGNVILYHNGTVITCDSMVRYDARHMDCFGSVVINRDSLYIYGDRVEYNGDEDMAQVYSPLIKITDGNAVMYTYHFSFNTKTNIGEFNGGGTVSQGEYLMEAWRGFYYANDRVMVGVGDVQMRNSAYVMESDSVSYDLNTEQATFHKRSNIWNNKGEILSADSGDYFKAENRYKFYSNAYILSEEQEIWADSLDYASATDEIEMWRNIQASDVKNRTMAFGNYAHYVSESGKGVLTDNPSVIRYEENNADTLFMRSDTIYVYQVDSLGYFELNRPDSGAMERVKSVEAPIEEEFSLEQFNSDLEQQRQPSQEDSQDEKAPVAEVQKSLSKRELRRQRKETAHSGRTNRKSRDHKDDTQQSASEVENKQNTSDVVTEDAGLPSSAMESDESQSESVLLTEPEDTASVVPTTETLADSGEMEKDAMVAENNDSQDQGRSEGAVLAEGETAKAEEKNEEQSDKVVVAFRNVKIFRNDFQAVCDSLLGFTADSTIEMHIKPILWNESNQITSNDVQIYTKYQQLERAVFTGNPIMASEVDTIRYDQVNGKTITASFVDGAIDRVDVNGNVKTYYYMVDDSDGTVQGFLDAKSADLTFNMEDQRVVRITFRTEPEYTIYPMDQIPADNTQRFEGFEWKGKNRPLRDDVFDRTIRPSEREHYEMLPQPEFTITASIGFYRTTLVESGMWADREDKISEDTVYFISTRPE